MATSAARLPLTTPKVASLDETIQAIKQALDEDQSNISALTKIMDLLFSRLSQEEVSDPEQLSLQKKAMALPVSELQIIWEALAEKEQEKLLSVLSAGMIHTICDYRLATFHLHALFHPIETNSLPDFAAGWNAENAQVFIKLLGGKNPPRVKLALIFRIKALNVENNTQENIIAWLRSVANEQKTLVQYFFNALPIHIWPELLKSKASGYPIDQILFDALTPNQRAKFLASSNREASLYTENSLFKEIRFSGAQRSWSPALMQTFITALQTLPEQQRMTAIQKIGVRTAEGKDTLIGHLVETGNIMPLTVLLEKVPHSKGSFLDLVISEWQNQYGNEVHADTQSRASRVFGWIIHNKPDPKANQVAYGNYIRGLLIQDQEALHKPTHLFWIGKLLPHLTHNEIMQLVEGKQPFCGDHGRNVWEKNILRAYQNYWTPTLHANNVAAAQSFLNGLINHPTLPLREKVSALYPGQKNIKEDLFAVTLLKDGGDPNDIAIWPEHVCHILLLIKQISLQANQLALHKVNQPSKKYISQGEGTKVKLQLAANNVLIETFRVLRDTRITPEELPVIHESLNRTLDMLEKFQDPDALTTSAKELHQFVKQAQNLPGQKSRWWLGRWFNALLTLVSLAVIFVSAGAIPATFGLSTIPLIAGGCVCAWGLFHTMQPRDQATGLRGAEESLAKAAKTYAKIARVP
jgi:hypothetical protein